MTTGLMAAVMAKLFITRQPRNAARGQMVTSYAPKTNNAVVMEIAATRLIAKVAWMASAKAIVTRICAKSVSKASAFHVSFWARSAAMAGVNNPVR